MTLKNEFRRENSKIKYEPETTLSEKFKVKFRKINLTSKFKFIKHLATDFGAKIQTSTKSSKMIEHLVR